MKKGIKLKAFAHRLAIKIFVALIRLTSRPDFREVLHIVHTVYDLATLHCKWLPELPPLP